MPGFRKIPPGVSEKIKLCKSKYFYVGSRKSYGISELAAGALAHLDITVTDGQVIAPTKVLPQPSAGRWSKWNVEGRRIRREDLPKVTKSWGWDAPVFGDWSKGTISHSRSREVYQWQTIYGQGLSLIVSAGDAAEGFVKIGLLVDRVFEKDSTFEERDLLLALSLMREATGRVEIVPSELSLDEWLRDQQVDWELLPVGRRPQDVATRIIQSLNVSPDSPRAHRINDRSEAIARLSPSDVVVGTGGFTRYFGFKFRDDLVALENLDYGNALYLMYKNWQALSQRSRLDLLAEPDAGYDRIIHRDGWVNRLRTLLLLHGHNPESPKV